MRYALRKQDKIATAYRWYINFRGFVVTNY